LRQIKMPPRPSGYFRGIVFDSPMEWCSRCGDWVALDQSLEERCRGGACRRDACPLTALFRSHARQLEQRSRCDPEVAL
jgi:hypothetical protein